MEMTPLLNVAEQAFYILIFGVFQILYFSKISHGTRYTAPSQMALIDVIRC
jgi:hypothetical protein